MASVPIFTRTEPGTREIGSSICNMGMALKTGTMVLCIKASTSKVKSMAWVHLRGKMGLILQATGRTIKLQVMENTHGATAESMKGSGSTI